MDRWIRIAWRAFWVGLGAALVLVVQALLPPTSLRSEAPAPASAPAAFEGATLGPLARPLRTSEPVRTPAITRARTKVAKPGA